MATLASIRANVEKNRTSLIVTGIVGLFTLSGAVMWKRRWSKDTKLMAQINRDASTIVNHFLHLRHGETPSPSNTRRYQAAKIRIAARCEEVRQSKEELPFARRAARLTVGWFQRMGIGDELPEFETSPQSPPRATHQKTQAALFQVA